VCVLLPPLRARLQDMSQLISHFVEIFSTRMGKKIHDIPEETLAALTSYSWPGNVRKLQNLIERAVIRSENGVLANPLPLPSRENPVLETPAQITFIDSQRALILQALREASWPVTQSDIANQDRRGENGWQSFAERSGS
jgi:formate hydrogenlyase transcriptional activator